MGGLVISGTAVAVPGLTIQSWLDDPSLRLKKGEDMRVRKTAWVRSIILHTTKGIPGGSDKRPQKIIPGCGPHIDAGQRVARYWSKDGRNAGAHIVVDFDGVVTCCADLASEATYHAGNVNDVSIGIEIYQGSDAELYEYQLEKVVTLVDFLTKHFQIQRQYHWPYLKRPIKGFEETGGAGFLGVFGHRDCSDNRGLGDPGDAVFEFLRQAGYMRFNFEAGEDKKFWREKQEPLKKINPALSVDGSPGPLTAQALLKNGKPSGQWVERPGD